MATAAVPVIPGKEDPNWLGNNAALNTTEGNDFWLTFMTNNHKEISDPSLNLTVYAVASDTAHIIVSANGSQIGAIDIPAGGGVGKLEKINPAVAYISHNDSETPLPVGLHVYSEDPKAFFSCYALSETGIGQGTTRDASLILPTRTLGREYFIQTYQTDTRATEFAIIATEDNTNVTIIPKALTSKNSQADVPIVLTGLRKGMAYQIRSSEPKEGDEEVPIDLSGSSVCANKPVAVLQGNEAVKIASGSVGSYSVDYAFEQALPVAEWGKEFYLGITEHAKFNFYNLLAAYDNTTVTISGLSTPLTLSAGQTLDEAYSLVNDASFVEKDVKITADKPVMLTSYLSCGGANQEIIRVGGKTITNNWGNSSAAMMPSWEMRVREMAFYTDTISNETSTGTGHMYVQVVTRTADAGTFTLDGAAVPAASFEAMTADAAMAVANIELTTEGRHSLQTTGEGFTGFVYTITSEARAYQYTLGFNPLMQHDSLFVENDEAVMSAKSYNLQRVDGIGWYQRQPKEWVRSRMDTASVCDTTLIQWRIDTPADTLLRVDSIHWVITALQQTVEEKDTVIVKGENTHRWQYEFILPEEVKSSRDPFVDYTVQALLYRTPLFCDDVHTDTLQTMVRVHAMYNDTVWRIVCAGDEFEFFSDSTLTTPSEHYATTFYYTESTKTDTLPDYKKYKYQPGIDTISRRYLSAGGCDSVSTLLLFVCESIRDTVDTTLCEKDLGNLNASLGDFFSKGYQTQTNIDFAASFAQRATDSRWVAMPDGSWTFDGTSALKTYSCRDAALEDFVGHGATYDGCDSTLTLHLRVMPTDVRTTSVSFCGSSYVWKDDQGHEIQTITKSAENTNTPKVYTHSIQYQSCPDCPAGGCDSVRYELTLMFVAGELATDTVRLCQNAGPVTRYHMNESWYFDPDSQPTGVPIDGQTMTFIGEGGCEYTFRYVFIVNALPVHRDSVVYCYREGEVVLHQWEGHNSFWYNEKGSPVKTFGGMITAEYPTDGQERRIFELSDTVHYYSGTDCDDVYYQVVILMPDYDVHTDHHMADDDTYEWAGKLLAGEHATTIDNPDNLEVVVMKPAGGTYPAGWTVTYDPTLKEYNISTTYQTDIIHTKDGVEQQCDSAVSLSLRVGTVFRDTTYTYTCSDNGYYWGWRKEVEVPKVTAPTEIFYYDSLTTRWPVIGLDSIYVLSLTVFPAYSDTVPVITCQDSSGYYWPGHMGPGHTLYINGVPMDPSWDSIPTVQVGHCLVSEYGSTRAREYRHPRLDTLIERSVICDSIWTLDLTVNEVYNSDYTYIEFIRGLKSNDTLTFYSPKTLFIGADFDDYRSGAKTADELRIEAGADQVEIVTQDSLYRKSAVSVLGCDSTTYLRLSLCRLVETFITDSIGDNDSTWLFGGNTTPDATGWREHTLDSVKGSRFNLDEAGNPIDYSSRGRTVRIHHYTDTLHTESGCDSIVYMTLHVFPTYRYDTATYTCHNKKFDWHGKENLNMLIGDNETGVVFVYDSLLTHDGKVDSVHVLELTIFPGELYNVSRTLCYNDTILWQAIEIAYDPENLITEVVHKFQPEEYECGREIHLFPTFNPSYGYRGAPDYNKWVDTLYACQYEDFHWYDRNGKEHTENLRDPSGRPVSTIPTDETGWFTLYDSLKTAGCHCDSIYTLHYRVNPVYHFYTEASICSGDVYEWYVNGTLHNTYTSEFMGDIYDTIRGLTVNGCDSVYYLHVLVDQSYEIPIDIQLCSAAEHFTWNGRSYDAELADARNWDAPKHYYDTLRLKTLGAGCDSTLCLHLTILPSKDSLWQDTICAGEIYQFFEQTLVASGTYTDSRLNQWGCLIDYVLTLFVLPPTQLSVEAEPVCLEHSGSGNTYGLHYLYDGEFAPLTYNVRYSEEAKEEGFEDLYGLPLPSSLKPNTAYTLELPVPDFGTPDNYPTPGTYSAVIGFENGVCDGDRLMSYPYTLHIHYPDWLLEQRHGDMIALLNEKYNGGYVWTEYRWYEGDSLLEGQTKPYLYLPTGLKVGTEYHVVLTREGETEAFPSCPIVAIANPVVNDYAPTQGYLAVTPTCITTAHPYATILSRKDGTYRITTSGGRFVSEGVFRADATAIEMPAIEGLYIVQLWSNDTPEEPYRAIKVIVSKQCPNCDISSF